MIRVDVIASDKRSRVVVEGVNALCDQAVYDYQQGHHVNCKVRDSMTRASMQPFPSFCILHALLAQKTGNNEGLVFTCPKGISGDDLLAVETASWDIFR